jgi:hypothetical protein
VAGHSPVIGVIAQLGQLARKPGQLGPSMARRPEAPVVVSIRPPSAQRRRVSSLTPVRSAASLIRNVGITRL